MLLLSPAKTLNFEKSQYSSHSFESPVFLDFSKQLIDHLKQYSEQEIGKMMDISQKLANTNYLRYKKWSIDHTTDTPNCNPAVYAFKGHSYEGLDIFSLAEKEISFLRKNLYILSGLYGILNAFHLIQPHRLEMGTRLLHPLEMSNSQAIYKLYSFWQEKVTNYILKLNPPLIINLASNEYAKVVNWERVKSKNIPVITPIFKDFKNDQYKIISFFAKKARGMMCSFLAKENCFRVDSIKKFNTTGYYFSEEVRHSDYLELIFLRDKL